MGEEHVMISIDELMTQSPLTMAPEDSLELAGKLMKEHRIRHIPIVDADNKVLGLVTQRDLLAAAVADRFSYTTEDIMRRKVYTVQQQDNLRAAALLMQKHKIGSLLVVDDERLVGIITDSDYVELAVTLLEQLEELDPDELEATEDFDDLDTFAEEGF